MAFSGNTVELDANGLGNGEVLEGHVNNSDAFETFEDGLNIGRFAKYDTGSLDNLDGSATPTIVGVVKRNLTGALTKETYDTTDDVAELCNFGYVTVEVVDGVTPAKYGAVYAENQTAGEYGKATTVSAGNVAVSNADFWRATNRDNVWIVRLKNIL